jgi:hypothetical protein
LKLPRAIDGLTFCSVMFMITAYVNCNKCADINSTEVTRVLDFSDRLVTKTVLLISLRHKPLGVSIVGVTDQPGTGD